MMCCREYAQKKQQMYQLKVIIASTRPTRKGPAVAQWMMDRIRGHGKFAVELLDLKAINLPFLDEPEHPRLRKYQHEHTKAWSRTIDAADAFVLVTCEYNHGMPAPLKNALDYLVHEWSYKPVGIVSYGGIAAGTRSAQMLKPVLSVLKMLPLPEAVSVPSFTNFIDEAGHFSGNEGLDRSALSMLDELHRWTEVLAPMRKK